jgi:hypothetical protein
LDRIVSVQTYGASDASTHRHIDIGSRHINDGLKACCAAQAKASPEERHPMKRLRVRSFAAAVLSSVILLVASGAVQAIAPAPTQLVGTWVNVHSNTNGIAKIVIGTSGSDITIHAFGACTPDPCDWGTVNGVAYSKAVDSSVAKGFTATFDSGFATDLLTGKLKQTAAGPRLVVFLFAHFTDGSTRNDYFNKDTFKRKP